MRKSIDHVIWKVRRAQKHLEDAKVISDGILNTHIRTVGSKIDDQGRQTIRLGEVNNLSPTFCVLIGEAAYQLRSALDYLMFAIANPTSPSQVRNVQFPIYLTRDKFRQHAKRSMPGVARGVLTIVESLQPYHSRKAPKTLTLGQLQVINNWDKHRLPAVAAISLESGGVLEVKIAGAPATIVRQQIIRQVLKPGAILARLQYADTNARHKKVDMKAEFTLKPIFDSSMPKPVAGREIFMVLDDAGRFIGNEVVPSFKRFL